MKKIFTFCSLFVFSLILVAATNPAAATFYCIADGPEESY